MEEGVAAMRKTAIIGLLAVAAVLIARSIRHRFAGLDWQRVIDQMPDDAPPKSMVDDVSEIRRNTERILESLGERVERTDVAAA
jgi:hypothetical protein